MLLEGTEKTTLVGGCQTVAILSLLTADSEKNGNISTEWDRHICRPRSVCICGWKSRSSKSLKEPTISTSRFAACTDDSHASARCTLQEHKFYPNLIQLVHELVAHNPPRRHASTQWISQQ
jgi:hypothetical protein